MYPFVSELKADLEVAADPVAAVPMAAYMRNQFPFLGIKTGALSQLLRARIAQSGLPDLADLDLILRELWALPEREFQFAGIGLLEKYLKVLPPNFIDSLAYLIKTKSWWDTVDSLAGTSVGTHFKRYPAVRDATLPDWRQSQHLWLRRSCILFQLGYKQETDFELLKDIIRENLGSKEFFINKAIGWALRTYSRVDAQAVRAFVAETPLHSLSAREALKWLARKGL